jgi:hypothetical protein
MSLISGMKSRVAGFVPKLTKMHFDPEKMSVEDIELPGVIKRDEADLRETIRDEINTYKALGYIDLPVDQLKFPEYHSYQVGNIMKYIKEDNVFVAQDIEKILNSASTSITKRNLHIKVFDIVFRYNEYVEKDATKEELQGDIKWTPLEVSYLLRYATLEDRAIPKKK